MIAQRQGAEHPLDPEQVWLLLLTLRRTVRTLSMLPGCFGLGLDAGQPAILSADDPAAWVIVHADGSWIARMPMSETGVELLDLYLPVALAGRSRPLTVAHLGQSLDGRIATTNGASCHINGPENLTHLHRMRALCDAIVVGAGTVECDDPQLTTRRVPGPHPVRVVLDPRRRLAAGHGLFQDRAAPTLLVCDEALTDRPGPSHVEIIGVPCTDQGLHLSEIVRHLHACGLYGIFIEGGGLTVSAFLQAGLLDRLQIAVAPLIIGSGRPGITLPAIEDLSQGLRPRHRRYAMGEDVLFDCRLGP
ncbi:MAG: RibD family protein [Candidatus Competibacteraceae bacterium]